MITGGSSIDFLEGNGTAGPFTVDIDFSSASELNGVYQTTAGAVSALTVASADPVAKTVTFNETVPALATLAVYRTVALTQTEQFRRHGNFDKVRHSDAFDKLTKMMQQLYEESDRLVKVHETTRFPFDLRPGNTLSQKAGGAIRVNAAGTGLDTLAEALTLETASQNATAAAASASAAAASATGAASFASSAATAAANAVANEEELSRLDEKLWGNSYEITSGDTITAAGVYHIGGTSDATVNISVADDESRVTIKSSSGNIRDITVNVQGSYVTPWTKPIVMRYPYQSLTLIRQNGVFHVADEWEDGGEEAIPQLKYVGDDSFTVRLIDTQVHDRMHMWLQDDHMWMYDGSSVTVDTTSATYYDDGVSTSLTADKHYYTYFVPDYSAGFRELKPVISLNDPETGPSGSSIYRFVGSIKVDSSGDIIEFRQAGARMYWVGHTVQVINYTNISGSTTTPPYGEWHGSGDYGNQGPFNTDTTLPMTAHKAIIHGYTLPYVDNTGFFHKLFITGGPFPTANPPLGTATTWVMEGFWQYVSQAKYGGTGTHEIPIDQSNGEIWSTWTGFGAAGQKNRMNIRCEGYVDGYLDE